MSAVMRIKTYKGEIEMNTISTVDTNTKSVEDFYSVYQNDNIPQNIQGKVMLAVIDGKTYYFDLKRYEEYIRCNERKKVYAERKSARNKIENERKKKNQYRKGLIIQKLIGILMLTLSVMFALSNITYDASIGKSDITFMLFVVPACLYIICTRKIVINI